MDDADFHALLRDARSGDPSAVATLLRSFEDDVRLMVRARLPRVLRSQFDSMDFVQSIWKSVFATPRPDADFRDPGHFRGYLAGVARNKVIAEYRRRTRSRKYEIAREESLYVRRGGQESLREVAAPGPSPSQEAQADDRLEQLAAGRSPVEVQVLELRRQGLTFEEIAARLGLHERTVRRVIDALRARMEARRWQ